MKGRIATVIMAIALAQLARADSTVQQAQEELKEQGYYSGQINGEKTADTIAAVRRFQIRSGLPVTGELDEQTLRTLHSGTASSSATTTATPEPQVSEDSDGPRRQVAPVTPAPDDASGLPRASVPPASRSAASIFSNTPYEMAPPEVQQQVVVGAQTLLRRRGFYKGVSDGLFTPNLEFSIRAFQSRLGIQPNGRLDMETLAALGLLPGQHGRTPMEMPHRRGVPGEEPPVRGEWIH